jgi:hypothetical protein
MLQLFPVFVLLLLSSYAHGQTAESSESQMRKPLPGAEEIAKLPEDGGEEFNRLIFEVSPYLRQHARNPVDWFPWGEEAFELAAKLDKPIFLSIGYSTCHWCHVMEHESFEDKEVAALMNRFFVCIKVDREERPDVDNVYMSFAQAFGSGGWPMTILMASDKKPFLAGTYYPKVGRGGRPGMMQLLPQVGEMWRSNRSQLLNQSDRLVEWVRAQTGPGDGTALEPGVVEKARAGLKVVSVVDESSPYPTSCAFCCVRMRIMAMLRPWKWWSGPWTRCAKVEFGTTWVLAFIATRPMRSGSSRTSRKCSTTKP